DENTESESPLSKQISDLEIDGVKLAESGDAEGALRKFEEAILLDPQRPSAYNNRAQTLRLFNRIDEALEDLNSAISLSNGKGKSACQAFTQRAMIYRLKERDDQAKEDFQKAAELGSEFAKAQLVQMNPYAALCNKMLHDVFTKIQKGERY
ncbi:Tetratricopeptide repeat protein 36, partial [Armadillidium vulgare]